jgi:hypothetical protein
VSGRQSTPEFPELPVTEVNRTAECKQSLSRAEASEFLLVTIISDHGMQALLLNASLQFEGGARLSNEDESSSPFLTGHTISN